jgi:RTX calcium-binding nonapeptide repeat (4 copies)
LKYYHICIFCRTLSVTSSRRARGHDDWLYGGDGNDHLDGGGDNDHLYGGNGGTDGVSTGGDAIYGLGGVLLAKYSHSSALPPWISGGVHGVEIMVTPHCFEMRCLRYPTRYVRTGHLQGQRPVDFVLRRYSLDERQRAIHGDLGDATSWQSSFLCVRDAAVREACAQFPD